MLSREYDVKELCDLMGVSRAGYYKWKKRGKPAYQDKREQVIALDSEVESLRNSIVEEEQNIAILSTRLKKSASIKRKLEAIRKMKDLTTLKELVKAIISRIEVYNADSICSILRIKYINGKMDEVVYCPQKLKHNYLVLPKQWDLVSKSPDRETEEYEESVE